MLMSYQVEESVFWDSITGQMVVATSSTTGLFAYAPSGTLANLALLTGSSSAYPLTVVQIGSDERYADETTLVSSAACSTSVDVDVISSVDGCSVLLGASQTRSITGATVSVSYGGFVASAPFDVYAPQEASLILADSTLNRFNHSQGESIPGPCASGSITVYPYQRTRITAFADGLDVTTIVSFVTLNSAVAAPASSRYDIIEGRQPGATSAHLSGKHPLADSTRSPL